MIKVLLYIEVEPVIVTNEQWMLALDAAATETAKDIGLARGERQVTDSEDGKKKVVCWEAE